MNIDKLFLANNRTNSPEFFDQLIFFSWIQLNNTIANVVALGKKKR